ncbi:alkaline phosphatase D family protein [Streptomyces sp. NBC_01336]|uniref:alkaline phosphatase D family protein n=1 Tax=Streptomyces sp. NBC_01336 TaxID=2903829 RepID=UPI002E0E4477|nr:alkaline phosphatase D family protein [Streptomyces sp. NBC_01336]
MPDNGLDRRKILTGGVAAALTAGAAAPAFAAGAAPGPARSAEVPLRAAVLEYEDPWTKALGLAELLGQAGFEVVPLDLALPADEQPQPVDLIAFGTFTNNSGEYLEYVADQADSLRRFVAGRGVVLDLAQSDQYGAPVAYLPAGVSAVRTDADYDTVYPVDAGHPLVKGQRVSNGRLFTGRNASPRVSYETVQRWSSMRVLMACAASGFPPALLEGQFGAGRFLVTSLTLDKIRNGAGVVVQPAEAVADSAAFFAALSGYVASVRSGTAPAVVPTPMPPERPVGPMVGHTEPGSARIWARPGLDPSLHARWNCAYRKAGRHDNRAWRTVTTRIEPDNDHTLIAQLPGLAPDAAYEFVLTPVKEAAGFTPMTGSFTTSPAPDKPSVVTMGMGSCGSSVPDHVWTKIMEEGCDSFVMLGDTPYVDSADLAVARQKHRTFLVQPEISRMISSMPVWATWDDHDFGGNDFHGDYKSKRQNRTAFVNYRANPTFGQTADGKILTQRTDGEGVYTSFRRGPIEVFLLDPRWFSRTAPSWADSTQLTCLGTVQWDWLRKQLRRSTAPFKAIATGMIWDDKQNAEKDDWATYSYEREAIYDFIKEEEIPGCFLIGGDIHVSRALSYGPRVGYDLWQFIVSPLHDSTIPSLNVPSPHLVHSAVEPHVFLKLVADTTLDMPTLTATWINRDGERLFEVTRTAGELGHTSYPRPSGSGRHDGAARQAGAEGEGRHR